MRANNYLGLQYVIPTIEVFTNRNEGSSAQMIQSAAMIIAGLQQTKKLRHIAHHTRAIVDIDLAL